MAITRLWGKGVSITLARMDQFIYSTIWVSIYNSTGATYEYLGGRPKTIPILFLWGGGGYRWWNRMRPSVLCTKLLQSSHVRVIRWLYSEEVSIEMLNSVHYGWNKGCLLLIAHLSVKFSRQIFKILNFF